MAYEFPYQYDNQTLSDGFFIEWDKGAKMEFQFPPKIKSDVKSANWNEIDQNSYEEKAVWMGAKARIITVETSYIVSGKWTNKKISDTVRIIRSHYYASGGTEGDKMPHLAMKGYLIIPEATGAAMERIARFRLKSASAKYSDEYVGIGSNAWPLRTDLSMEFALLSMTGVDDKSKKTIEDTNSYGRIPSKVNELWY